MIIQDGEGVRYGYEEHNRGFYIITDFVEENYYYFEKHGENTFHRRWGKSTHDGLTWIEYKNLAYYGAPNRFDYWRLFITQEDRKILLMKRQSIFEYYMFSKDGAEEYDHGAIDFSRAKKVSEQEEREARIPVIIHSIMDKIMEKYRVLYNQVQNKDAFLRELEEHYQDVIKGDENETDIENYVLESEQFFLNFINVEKLNFFIKTVNLEFFKNEFPNFKNFLENVDIALVDVDAVFKDKQSRDEFTIYVYTLQDFVNELEDEINLEANRVKFKDKNEIMALVLKTYQELIEFIIDKETFLVQLEKEVEKSNGFLLGIDLFIKRYFEEEQRVYGKQAFIDEYGSDRVTILLNDEKKARFDTISSVELLSNEMRKEYEMYQELKEVYIANAYCKNGKRLKPALTVAHQYIDRLNRLKEAAISSNLIEWVGESYEFISFAKVKEFAQQFMEI